MARELIFMIVCLILWTLGIVVIFLPREQRPNARIIAQAGTLLWAEIVCDCGARQVITFTAGQTMAAVMCLRCGINVVPEFDWESQRLIAAARE